MSDIKIKNAIIFENILNKQDFIDHFDNIICNLSKYSMNIIPKYQYSKLYKDYYNISQEIEKLLIEKKIDLNKETFLLVFFSDLLNLNVNDYLSNNYDKLFIEEQFPFNVDDELYNNKYFNLVIYDKLTNLLGKVFEFQSSEFLDELGFPYSLDFFLTYLFSIFLKSRIFVL